MSDAPSSFPAGPVPERLRRWLGIVTIATLLCVFAIDAFGKAIRTGSLDVTSLPDFAVLLSFSRQTLAALAPPFDWWFYPPPFVVVFAGLGSLGNEAASLIWLVVIVAAACFDLWASAWLVGLTRHRWAIVIAGGACGLVYYYLQRDLRAANVNLVYLAAVLGGFVCARRGRIGWAGGLLAASIVLKLYSALLLPYLAYRREWRWLAAALGWLALLFVALPALVLGPEAALQLSANWLGRLLSPGEMPDHYKSLAYTMQALVGADSARAAIWTRGLQLSWVIAVGACFAAVHGHRQPRTASELEVCDLSLLMLLPLPLSPAFQPPHGVVLLLPTLLLIAAALDPRRSPRLRAVALGLPLSGFVVVKLVSQWPERGAAVMLAVCLTATAVAFIARRPAPAVQ